ncbi:MAG: hypothetical protein IJU51_06485 [Clostridia bacterium]|nr:hypothetical protein [Clostridia bacterium]
MDGYENLANAIILQAVKDYRKALRRLNRNFQNKDAKRTVSEVERFFRSDWYKTLTSVDGELLINKLREESRI